MDLFTALPSKYFLRFTDRDGWPDSLTRDDDGNVTGIRCCIEQHGVDVEFILPVAPA